MPSAIHPEPPAVTKYKQFQVDRHSFSRPYHYDITEINGNGVFYIETNAIKRKKASLTLHAGSSVDTPVVAVSHIVVFGGHFKIGRGDPASADSVAWEDMLRQNIGGSEFRWETAFAGSGETYAQPRPLMWKRTQTVAVEGMELPRISLRNYKLVDEGTGDILAVFTSKRTVRNCGMLELRVELGQVFEQLVIVTCISLYEKARRE